VLHPAPRVDVDLEAEDAVGGGHSYPQWGTLLPIARG
jgi:hypothetical protein